MYILRADPMERCGRIEGGFQTRLEKKKRKACNSHAMKS